MTPPRLAKIHRALTKIALECACLDYGEERLLSAEFDRERRIILDAGHHGYIILPKQGDPEHRGSSLNILHARRNDDGHPFMGIAANILGVHLFTDTLQPAPAETPNEDFASVHPF